WRQDRTYHPPAEHCPLCPTKPGQPETEIPEPDYYIVVFENRFPSYTGDQGRAEVVCYTPDHDSSLGEQSVEHIRDLIEVWRDRTSELGRLPNVRYVYVVENRREEIRVTLIHHRGGLTDLDAQDDESFARNLKGLLQKYDRLFAKPLPYVMAMHQRPPGRAARHHHFHIEFYPPNRTRDKLKYLAGSELGAGA